MDEGNTRKYVSSWEKYLFLNTGDTENYYLFLGDVFSILKFVCLFVGLFFNPHSDFCCPKSGKMRGRDHGKFQS